MEPYQSSQRKERQTIEAFFSSANLMNDLASIFQGIPGQFLSPVLLEIHVEDD
jgi:hypothetical protein